MRTVKQYLKDSVNVDPKAERAKELFKPADIPFNLRGGLLDDSVTSEGRARVNAEREAKARKAQMVAAFADKVYEASEPQPPPDTLTVDKPCEARFWNGKEWQFCDKQPPTPDCDDRCRWHDPENEWGGDRLRDEGRNDDGSGESYAERNQ